MSVAIRGVRNALRNKIRTSAVVLVLSVTIGLTLSMLIANIAVSDKLAALRADLDTTVKARPAFGPGAPGTADSSGEGQNEQDATKLTAEQLAKAEGVEHVEAVTAYVNGALIPPDGGKDEGDGKKGGPSLELRGPGGSATGSTDLKNHITAEDFGAPPETSGTFPINVTGVTSDLDSNGRPYDIVDGRMITEDDTRAAVISERLAEHNGLKVGDDFEAYDETFTVVGIAKSHTGTFDSVGVVMRAEALWELADLDGYDVIAVQVDEPENVDSVVNELGEMFGKTVSVESESRSALQAVEGLKTVDRISWIGFLVSILCAAVIVFFTLTLTVRERRREVGVLKAIGGTNRGVITQFVTESVALVTMGTVLGLGVAALSSNALAGALVASNAPDDSATGGPRLQVIGDDGPEQVRSAADLIGDVAAGVGPQALIVGALVALGIAILGSAIPAWLIARIRPAEVLRGE